MQCWLGLLRPVYCQYCNDWLLDKHCMALLRCLRRAIHAPFLVRSSTDVVSASIHMLMTHSFISASPHTHLSIVCMKLKSGCHLTYSGSIAIKLEKGICGSKCLSPEGWGSVSGLLTAVLPPHTWKCTTWVSSWTLYSFLAHIKYRHQICFPHLRNISRLWPQLL